ncbi:methyltransferase domain-containing protein [Bradyrhizobium sp. 157]|nr:methyltransferase domain-containing protein [Bradyrhizobium sp. 157]
MSEAHWQLEGSAAELYQRYLVPAITTKWAEDLVARAQPRVGDAVLDVACGTGVVARLAAHRVTAGQVTGLDLNAGMLAVARSLPSEVSPISWVEGSALNLPFRSESFDVVLCQLGLQFFPDQSKALNECTACCATWDVPRLASTARSSTHMEPMHSWARWTKFSAKTHPGSSVASIPSPTLRSSKNVYAKLTSM